MTKQQKIICPTCKGGIYKGISYIKEKFDSCIIEDVKLIKCSECVDGFLYPENDSSYDKTTTES